MLNTYKYISIINSALGALLLRSGPRLSLQLSLHIMSFCCRGKPAEFGRMHKNTEAKMLKC